MKPSVLDETEDFAVVFKPPRLHCAPLKNSEADTLLDWYATLFPPVMELSGRRKGDGGLLHRLDFETQGLVLFAKNQKSLDFLLRQQEEGYFIKEYSALCQKGDSPPKPEGFVIESYFRPFGPGRKEVRPVMDTVGKNKELAKDKGAFYRTEIISVSKTEQGYLSFALRLRRGFRHQIRSHLAWIGCPVLNDLLYGSAAAGRSNNDFLTLRANGLVFNNPGNGIQQKYRIEPL